MARPSKEQLAFFLHHEIPLSKMFDATNYSTRDYKIIMSDLGMLVAIGVTPCKEKGHTIRTRAGHCAQCKPHTLAFLRRFDNDGDVYVASSEAIGLTKIGTAQDAYARLKTLNYFGYGGATDWDVEFVIQCKQAGLIEFVAHQKLAGYSVWRDYEKQGESVRCQELFNCSAKVAIEAIKNVL